jgi:hypothetical protein
VLRARTEQGHLYFKASAPGLHFEAVLTQTVARRRPDAVPALVAADPERGWLLLADGGPALREIADDVGDTSRWEDVLRVYAGLQIDLAADTDALLAAGTPDKRPPALAAAYPELLGRADAIGLGRADGLTEDEQARLLALAPRIAGLAERADGVVPASVAHEELHPGNILVGPRGFAFVDWAEASVGHPFAGLVVCLHRIADELGVDDRSPELDRFRDAYLEQWTAFAPAEALRETYPLALRLGLLCRALTWDSILSPLPAAVAAEYGERVAVWLRLLLAELEGGEASGGLDA